MRWLYVLVLAACGRVGFDPSEVADAFVAPPDPRLRLYLPFDGSGAALHADRFGHATDCTSCPAPATARDGTEAASFDGTACVRVTDAADLRAATFTYAVWWRTATSQSTTVFSRPEASETGLANTFEVYFIGDSLLMVVHRVTSTQALTAGAWHHGAASYDGTTYRAYLDGALLREQVVAPTVLTANDLKIGCDRNFAADESFFVGDIDDARFYNAVLSETEISDLAR